MKRSPLAHDRVFSDEDYAQRYAQQHGGMAERFGHECAGKLASRGFETGKVIDVGCGFGATVLVLAETFADSEFVGIDLSDPLLLLAKRSADAADLEVRVRFEKADAPRIPFDDETFDAAINVNMVHLVEDPIGMLNEIERVLAPEGFLFIADLRRTWLGLVEGEIKSALTPGEARELFGRSKLRRGAFTSGLLWWRFEA